MPVAAASLSAAWIFQTKGQRRARLSWQSWREGRRRRVSSACASWPLRTHAGRPALSQWPLQLCLSLRGAHSHMRQVQQTGTSRSRQGGARAHSATSVRCSAAPPPRSAPPARRGPSGCRPAPAMRHPHPRRAPAASAGAAGVSTGGSVSAGRATQRSPNPSPRQPPSTPPPAPAPAPAVTAGRPPAHRGHGKACDQACIMRDEHGPCRRRPCRRHPCRCHPRTSAHSSAFRRSSSSCAAVSEVAASRSSAGRKGWGGQRCRWSGGRQPGGRCPGRGIAGSTPVVPGSLQPCAGPVAAALPMARAPRLRQASKAWARGRSRAAAPFIVAGRPGRFRGKRLYRRRRWVQGSRPGSATLSRAQQRSQHERRSHVSHPRGSRSHLPGLNRQMRTLWC